MAEETIRVVIDDAQLNEVIARIDEASVKAARLGVQAPIIPSAAPSITPTTVPPHTHPTVPPHTHPTAPSITPSAIPTTIPSAPFLTTGYTTTTPITTATRSATALNAMILAARKNARAAGINLDDLPTLNRDMRLLAGSLNIPGFREASAAFFQTRRGVRAGQLGREAKALRAAGLAPELAGQLSVQALLGQAALVAFVVTIVVDTIKKFIEAEREAKIELENMLQEGLDLNYNELSGLLRIQTGYASWWNQFQAAVETDGFKQAVADTVRGVLPALLQGEYRGAASYPGEPKSRWQLFEDIRAMVPELLQKEYRGATSYPGEPKTIGQLFEDIRAMLPELLQGEYTEDMIPGESINYP